MRSCCSGQFCKPLSHRSDSNKARADCYLKPVNGENTQDSSSTLKKKFLNMFYSLWTRRKRKLFRKEMLRAQGK